MKNLTKAEFIERFTRDTGRSIREAREVYDLVFGYMKECLDNGGKVKIPDVGIIHNHYLEAKEYPVPGTKEKVLKPRRRTFRIEAKIEEV